jgi:mono/diheme cytochrome c family protein
MREKNSKGATILSTLGLAAVVLMAGLGLYAASGIYPIGADVPHWEITHEALEFFRERAVEHQAQAVKVPAGLDSQARLREGSEHYLEMCQGCHLKPEQPETEMHQGLYPKPPDFSSMKDVVDPQEAFWVIKHGIKLSAMPAWGKSHGDDKLWALVAFVRKLPGMSPAEYEEDKALAGSADDRRHEDDDHQGEQDYKAWHGD